jgi:phenylalanyl-tRNA synthetase alpha subunit
MTLNEFLSKAGDLFKAHQPDVALATENASLKAEIETFQNKLTLAESSITSLTEKLSAAETARKESDEKAKVEIKAAKEQAEKSITEKEAEVEKRASAKALEIAGSQGISLGVVKPDKQESDATEPAKGSDKVRAAFLQQIRKQKD